MIDTVNEMTVEIGEDKYDLKKNCFFFVLFFTYKYINKFFML